MNKLSDFVALIFIGVVFILTFVAVLGVWGIFEGDVVYKSFMTFGLIGVVALIVMAFMKDKNGTSAYPPNPLFLPIKQFTTTIVIISVVILALLGILSIWEVISDRDILYKAFSSLIVVAFGGGIVVATAREKIKS